MRKLYYIFCICIVVSCSDDPADVPAICDLTAIHLSAKPGEGSASHNIKDVWAFLDGVDLGIYEIPAKIPVIPIDGEDNALQLSAGVRNNGINSTPIIYPFYQFKIYEKDFSPGTVESFDLTYVYRPDTKFAMIEDFENTNVFMFDEDGDSNTTLELSTADVFEGDRSGHIELRDSLDFIEVATSISFEDLPLTGSPVFMEMDYKNNIDINVGLIGFLSNNPIKFYKIVLTPQEDWNKIYIDFTFDLVESQLDAYKIVLGAGLTDEQTEGDIFIDNVKLLHF